MADDDNVTSLGAAANDALDDEELDGVQPHLPGTDLARVKFVGMAWETQEVPGLKEEVQFTVQGIVVGHGEEVMADGDVREIAKVKVQSVKRTDNED